MKIMLDFDSVTADLDTHMRNSVNARFGTNYQHEEITSWDWWTDRPEEQATFVWGPECFGSREWTLAMPPVEGAIEGIGELIDEGHAIVVVSDRSPHMRTWLYEWFRNHGLAMPIHTTSRHTGPTKLDVIGKLGLELVIEDAPHHAVEMSESGLVDAVFLLDKPWNQGVDGPLIGRCFNWPQVVEWIGLIEFMWGADSRQVIRG